MVALTWVCSEIRKSLIRTRGSLTGISFCTRNFFPTPENFETLTLILSCLNDNEESWLPFFFTFPEVGAAARLTLRFWHGQLKINIW